jgi:hypothetical protein
MWLEAGFAQEFRDMEAKHERKGGGPATCGDRHADARGHLRRLTRFGKPSFPPPCAQAPRRP